MLPDHDHKNFPFLVIQYELSWSIMICFLALAMNMIILGLTYRYVIPMVYVAWSMNEITLMIDSLFQYIEWIICLFWYTQCVLYQYSHILHAMELNKKYYTGRALDNRMGGFMIAEVAKRLHNDKKKLDFGL